MTTHKCIWAFLCFTHVAYRKTHVAYRKTHAHLAYIQYCRNSSKHTRMYFQNREYCDRCAPMYQQKSKRKKLSNCFDCVHNKPHSNFDNECLFAVILLLCFVFGFSFAFG